MLYRKIISPYCGNDNNGINMSMLWAECEGFLNVKPGSKYSTQWNSKGLI